MFLGVNMFLARLRLILARAAKMSSEKGQKHIYAQEHQLYYYYNNFRGHSQKEETVSDRDIFCERCRNRVGVFFVDVYFIVQKLSLSQKLKTLAEHRKICQKNLCF